MTTHDKIEQEGNWTAGIDVFADGCRVTLSNVFTETSFPIDLRGWDGQRAADFAAFGLAWLMEEDGSAAASGWTPKAILQDVGTILERFVRLGGSFDLLHGTELWDED